jgi:hypothetical protein
MTLSTTTVGVEGSCIFKFILEDSLSQVTETITRVSIIFERIWGLLLSEAWVTSRPEGVWVGRTTLMLLTWPMRIHI